MKISKPPILTQAQCNLAFRNSPWPRGYYPSIDEMTTTLECLLQAQRDADAVYYERLLERQKAGGHEVGL